MTLAILVALSRGFNHSGQVWGDVSQTCYISKSKCRFPNKDLQNRIQESLTCINGILVLLFKKLDYFYEWSELSDHSF